MAAFGRSNSWNQGLVGGMAIVQRRMASVVPGVRHDGDGLARVRPHDAVAARGDALGEGPQRLAAGHAGVLRSPGPVAGLHFPLRIPASELELEQAIVELHLEAGEGGRAAPPFREPGASDSHRWPQETRPRAPRRRLRPAAAQARRGVCRGRTNRRRHAPVHGAPGRGGRGQSPGSHPHNACRIEPAEFTT